MPHCLLSLWHGAVVALSLWLFFVSSIQGREIAGSDFYESYFHRLFSISRSTNRNELIYEVHTTATGIDSGNPIRIYWVMSENRGEREALTSMERNMAYGVTVKSVSSQKVIFVLKAMPNRNIAVTLTKTGSALTVMKIDGKECSLNEVYIQSTDGLIPSVKYIDVQGKTLNEGTLTTERIVPKK